MSVYRRFQSYNWFVGVYSFPDLLRYLQETIVR